MNNDFALSAPDILAPAPTQAPGTRVAAPDQEPTLLLAREFESMLILQMLRQMQQSVTADGGDETGFGSNPLGDTLFQEVAQQLSRSGGFGLADGLAEAMDRGRGGLTANPLDAQPSPMPPSIERRTLPIDREPFPLPDAAVPLPMDSRVSSNFGWREDPFSGDRRFHGGVDIPAPQGRDVPAARAGRVVFAGAQGGYGRTVVVEHDNGVRTRYAHLASTQVAEGDRVRAGQVVGQVGQTGRATGPHLHFEVIQAGQRVDPHLAARRFAEALKKVGPVADFPNGGPDDGPGIAVE